MYSYVHRSSVYCFFYNLIYLLDNTCNLAQFTHGYNYSELEVELKKILYTNLEGM